jgi:multidrug resistance efflux pump
MYNGGRIPTPWSHRWRRMRYGLLPVVSFCVCLTVTLWLWHRQGQLPHAVGEVEVVRMDVASGADGRLLPLSTVRPAWTLLDSVQAGQVIARLDSTQLDAQIEALQAGLTRLDAAVKAERAKLEAGENDRQQLYAREAARLQCELEQRRLEALRLQASIEADRADLQRLKTELEFLEPLYEKNMVPEKEYTNQKLLCTVVATRIEENVKTLAEVETQREATAARVAEFPALEETDVETVLEPLREAITEQQALIAALQPQIDALVIRAPASGHISAIYRWPGENVRRGDPIVAIAVQGGGYPAREPCIVSYVRQDQRIRPVEGMTVEVRVRAAASRPVATTVEQVGPQIEPVPLHQCRDPKLPEWGVPVRIRIPEGFLGRPGELIDITFKGT